MVKAIPEEIGPAQGRKIQLETPESVSNNNVYDLIFSDTIP